MTPRPVSDYTVPRTAEEVSNTIRITKEFISMCIGCPRGGSHIPSGATTSTTRLMNFGINLMLM